jgi:DNA replication protein DnaC
MYKVEQYKDLVETLDSETQKRFEMVRQLSKDFSVENTTAHKLDELLAEIIELINVPKKEPVTAKAKPRKSSEPGSEMSQLEQSFHELLEELTKRKPSGNIAPGEIIKAVRLALSETKIGFSQLEDEVKDRIKIQPQIIKIEIPKVDTKAFEKPEIQSFQYIVDDVLMGNNVMLVGGAGTGKTYLAENLISRLALGREYITINCSQWTSPTEIIGGQTMDGYVEGKLIEAWKNGYVLILDELPKIDPNTAGLFNDALAKTKVDKAIIFNSKKESFVKHKDFACIATGNIYPDKESISYGANNRQDLSLLDRFSGSVYFIEKNPEIERRILQNDMIWSICDRIRTGIEELKYEAQLSLRFMQNAKDTYNLEMQRLGQKAKSGIKADDGKTLKVAIDNYLSTFTQVQQKNLKDRIRYGDLFSEYDYRGFDKNKMVY